MGQEAYDKLWKLIGLRYKSHPWHGIEIGKRTPRVVTSFIEVIPSDTVKYEVDKKTGYLKIDRPQKFSNIVPALYGFIPQTYCKEEVAAYCPPRISSLFSGTASSCCYLCNRSSSVATLSSSGLGTADQCPICRQRKRRTYQRHACRFLVRRRR